MFRESEVVNGDLHQRMQRWKDDLEVYEKAKEMRDKGELALDDPWWKEHEKALVRAEAYNGLLFTVNSD